MVAVVVCLCSVSETCIHVIEVKKGISNDLCFHLQNALPVTYPIFDPLSQQGAVYRKTIILQV